MPHLCTIETASVLRGLVMGSKLTPARAEAALSDLAVLPAIRHAHEPFLARTWELRDSVSAYDAVYVALAEALGAILLTCDARLARAPLPGVTIEVIEPSN